MKVAVITAYHELTPELEQCMRSVRDQDYQNIIHIMVGDGCNLAFTPVNPVYNIVLPKNINDYGDSPRAMGVLYAKSIGADAIVFLDSDNWFTPNHIERMVQTATLNGSHVVACKRQICDLDGAVMGICPDSNGIMFCDTNCLLVTKALFEPLSFGWLIPDHLHMIGDRIIWDRLIHSTEKVSILNEAGVYYRSAFPGHYRMFNRPLPSNIKTGNEILEQKDHIENLANRSFIRMKAILKTG